MIGVAGMLREIGIRDEVIRQTLTIARLELSIAEVR